MRIISAFVAAAAASLLGGTAQAAWHKASSDHFVLYADTSPERLRAFASKMERYDKAVQIATKIPDYPVGDGNRVTVFLVPQAQVGALIGSRDAGVGGFYIGHSSGPVAYSMTKADEAGSSISARRSKTNDGFTGEIVLFHEYGHHLMYQTQDRVYPAWLSEGFAEFLSTVEVEEDGSVILGNAIQNRSAVLFGALHLPLDQMLSGNYELITGEEMASIYARGWLLTHYLNFEPSRKGQLDTYLAAMSKGVDGLQAARSAFGDLKQLDRELDRYQAGKLSALRIPASMVQIGPVEVTALSDGAAAALPFRMRSRRGVSVASAKTVAEGLRAVQRRFTGDPFVEMALAEAELDVKQYQAASDAADRALAADPANIQAMIYKGRSLAKLAEAAEGDKAQMFAEARRWLIKANKLDTEDPEPLIEYHATFKAEGIAPTAGAKAGLHYASKLAPQDPLLRMKSAIQYLRDGDLANARLTLSPLAFNPHKPKDEEDYTRKAVEAIDAGNGKAALVALEEAEKKRKKDEA